MNKEPISVSSRLLREYRNFIKKIERENAQPIDLTPMGITLLQDHPRKNPNRRNPFAVASEQRVEKWAKTHGIWSEAYSPDTNTMGAYLHPFTPNKEILDVINQMYALLFHFDDFYGNDIQKDLKDPQKKRGKLMMKELVELIDSVDDIDNETSAHTLSQFGLVNAAKEFLLKLKTLAHNPVWFANFIKVLKEHLQYAIVDQNDFALDENLGYEENMTVYLKRRNAISGMFVTTEFMELATGKYIQWDALSPKMSTLCNDIKELTAFIGSIGNDLFSFEKECVYRRDIFNSVPLTMIFYPEFTLLQAIQKCLEFMNENCQKFLDICKQIEDEISDPEFPENQKEAIISYVEQALSASIATWNWELDTDRYSNMKSIFLQTLVSWRKKFGFQGKLRSGVPTPVE